MWRPLRYTTEYNGYSASDGRQQKLFLVKYGSKWQVYFEKNALSRGFRGGTAKTGTQRGAIASKIPLCQTTPLLILPMPYDRQEGDVPGWLEPPNVAVVDECEDCFVSQMVVANRRRVAEVV